jgi:Fur family ferric uptake transcriptional regulator
MQRETRQRRAIRKVFEDATRPLSPEEVLDEGQGDVPSLGIATVYRNVRLLADEGFLTEVEIPGSGARYELASRPHHHHFVCRTCDRVFDMHGCLPKVEDLAADGFEVDDHEVILYGRCRSCVAPHTPARQRP